MKQKIEIEVLDNGYIVRMKNYFYGDVSDKNLIFKSKIELLDWLKNNIFD